MTLSMKFVALVMTAGVVVFALYLAWLVQSQKTAVEEQVLAEARVLDLEMNAGWDYIDSIQDQINYSDGLYDFKNVYCSVAGKSIALRFTKNSDYTIRYARERPRSGTDEPDEFESRALQSFGENRETEYYELTEFEGEAAFRYASALTIKDNCLQCHGEPTGSYDETGFIKEGMQLGDLAGATSIIIPLDRYIDSAIAGIVSAAVFFCLLMAVVTVIIWLALRTWVTGPMKVANDRLHSENEAQSSFLATMSHELRTPLSSILAFTDIWKRTAKDKNEEEERLVGEVETNSLQLLDMVNNTLDTARSDAGKLEISFSDVDVADEANAVKAIAHPLAQKKGIDFAMRVSSSVPVVVSDQEAIHKILVNLVGNAIKFTQPYGSVSLLADYRDGLLILSVRDNGIGIAQKDIESVFERFVRLGANPDAKERGTGLGLPLVRTLAEMLGGTVKVESEPGLGSTFTVSIPAQPSRNGEEGY